IRRPPLSAVFSPRVSFPFRCCAGVSPLAGAASKPLYSLATQSVRSVKALRSSAVCHSRRLPFPSYFEPSSSKPWVISCPMTTPIPPKFTAGSMEKSKNGGWRIPAGKLMSFVDRLSQLIQVVIQLKSRIAMQIPDEIVALDLEGRIIAPFLGIADLVANHRQLFLSGLLGLVAHPGKGFDVIAQRL